MKKCALLLTVIVSLSEVGAQTAPTYILSWGSESCGTFVAENATGKDAFLVWALGYISGVNSRVAEGSREVGKSWDRNSALLWLENYCAANPLAHFVTAAENYRNALAKFRTAILDRHSRPVATIGADARPNWNERAPPSPYLKVLNISISNS
jgi:hypothetical protein